VGEPRVAVEKIRRRSADHRGKASRRWEEARASQARRACARDTKQEERYKVAGQDREHRTPPRWASGRLSGPASRGPGARGSWSGRWGTAVPGTHGRAGDAGHHVFRAGPRGETPGSPTVSRQLQGIAEPAKRSPEMVCNTGVHWSDRACVRAASRQTRKRRAPGVDKGTARQSADNVDDTLRDLPERVRAQREVAPPVERVGIEQDEGKQRPRGTPCCEDKMVQRAVVRMVEAIFAPDVPVCSQGCSTGSSQHQARHAWRAQCRKVTIAGSVDAEGRGLCDNLDGGHLRECLQQRVREGGRVRRRGTWLHAGSRESGERPSPDQGAPQGGVSAPMVSKVCLPRVVDAWCVKDGHPRRPGRCGVRRCADDCLIGFALAADAHRVRAGFPKRCARFRLTMHPAQTVLTACKRPPRRDHSAGGTGPVAVLGCPP